MTAQSASSDDPYFVYAGLYEISEVARIVNVTAHLPDAYSHISNRQVLRWIRRGLALPRLSELHGTELLLSFQDLISMRVIALLRAVGIPWRKIYTAEKWLRTYTGSDRPFATQALWTAAGEVFTDRQGALVAASMGGQYPFRELLEQYLVPVAGLTFDPNGRAIAWEPHKHVLINPAIQFGAPCIKGTRIPTETVYGMYEAADSEQLIAKVYSIEVDVVREAIEWEKRLAKAA